MMSNLKPYLSYKPSGVEWLGDVPAHWEVRRLKSLAALIMGQSPSSEDCSDVPIGPPFLQSCAEFGIRHPTPVQYCRTPSKISPPGAILMSVRAPIGRVNISNQEYGIGQGLCAIVPNNKVLQAEFVQYQLEVLGHGLNRVATGSTYEVVSVGDVGNHLLSVPPLLEQTAIVRYLDHTDERIRRFISSKEQLIGLLEEYRQVVIHHAVTRGLEPNVRFKPSGVEWLGDVPAHWNVTVVKRHYSIQLGKMLQNHPNDPTDVEVPYLKEQHVQWFSVRTANAPKMWVSPNEIEQFGIRAGDLLVCEEGEVGRCGLVGDVRPGYIIQNALHRVRSSGTDRNDYLQYVMSSISKTGWFDAINNKATIAHFTAEKFGSLMIPVPPLSEQTAIVTYIDRTTADIDTAIGRAQREIELLGEYRTRLIADVVTGQVDVREAVADLPQ